MKVHSCHECSYQTERMYNLKVHQKNKHKNVDENIIPQVGIGQAHVVYQQNIQHEQNPDTQPVYHPVNVGGNYQQPSMNGGVFKDYAQAVCHQSLGVGGNYQQPSMNGRELQDRAQVVYQQNYPQLPLTSPATYNQFNIPPPQQLSYQTAYLGGYDQHPMQPQIKCSMSHGQIHGESNGAFQHGSSLQSNIPLNANVETQSEVESDEGEPDILELLKDTEKIFLETLYIKEEYLFALTKLRRLGDKEIKRFLKRYVRFKVRLMNHYEVIESDESESDESVSPDSDGEGSMDTNDGGDDAEEGEGGVGEVNDGGVGVDEGDESSGSESMDANDGDVDESSESVTDPESLEIEEKDTQEKEGESEKGDEEDLSRDQFFDFIFKVEDYLDEELLGWLKKYEGMAEKEIRMENLNIMSKDSLRDRVNLLNIKHKGKDRLLYMKFCSDDCIHAISECCHNILKNRFKFNNGQKSTVRKKFKPIEADIRRLVKPSTSIKSKRKILQKPQVGNGVLGIIASLVMPALMKLFLK